MSDLNIKICDVFAGLFPCVSTRTHTPVVWDNVYFQGGNYGIKKLYQITHVILY